MTTARPLTAEEYLTQQFFEWEVRGRGWLLWEYPVQLEPPFQPFIGHSTPRIAVPDDGRRPGFFEKIAARFSKPAINGLEEDPFLGMVVPGVWEAPTPDYDDIGELPIDFQVGLPQTFTPKRESADQVLLALSSARDTVAYEIVGRPDAITIHIVARPADRGFVRQQHEAYFPDIALVEGSEGLAHWWMQSPDGSSAVVDFGLSNEFMRPLRPIAGFEVDPLIAVVGALTDVEEGELACCQVLFHAVRNPWSSSILRAVTDNDGGAFFSDAPEMLALARQKVARPLFATVVRLAAKSWERQRAWELVRSMSAGLRRLCDPPSNELIPLTNDDYPDDVHVEDLLLRRSHRSGMILNADELVVLAHLPAASVQSEKLKRDAKKSKAAPKVAQGNELVIGENTHKGRTVEVSLNASQRVRHTYIIGASGTGKSTLVLNMAIQDIEHGHGVGVLDPHGDLIDAIIERIPDDRVNDVIVFDPADEGYPIGFNILSAHSELEKTLLASDLVAVFRRLSTTWGDQMNSVLANAILAFLESDVGGTLLDLRRFLVDTTFRRQFLRTVKDPEVVFYFEKEFEMLGGRPQAPVLTRLDAFLRPKPIRYIVAQKDAKLDFRKIIDERKIFLARLSQGAIGEENAYLLGTLLVAKFHQVAISRQDIAEEDRPNFFLTIDEFHNFLAPSLAQILSGARKFHMGLVLAHQDMLQLWRIDPGIGSATLTNPCTRVCFRVGDMDAKRLESGFAAFNATELQTLGTGDAIARVERSDYDFNLRTKVLPAVAPEIAKGLHDRVLAASRGAYARPRADIEAEIAAYWAAIHENEQASTPARPKEPPTQAKSPTPKGPDTPVSPSPAAPRATTPQPAATGAPQTPAHSEAPKAPPPTPGRGGREHKYLQNLVKRLAEDREFRATIEQSILGGAGSVDVSLEKGAQKIACEISITTTTDQEIDNIQKCLAAGYSSVVALAGDPATLRKLKASAEATLSAETLSRVRFLSPEEFVAYLDELAAAEASSENTIRGRKVTVNFKPVGEEEAEARRQALSKILTDGVKRAKKGTKPKK